MRDSRSVKTLIAEIFFMMHYDSKNQNDQLVEILTRYGIIDDKMIKRRLAAMNLFKTMFDAMDDFFIGESKETKQARLTDPKNNTDMMARDLALHYTFSRSALYVGDKDVCRKFFKVVNAVKNIVSQERKELIEQAEKEYRKVA